MAANCTDKIAREMRRGESADFDLANYDKARIDTLVDEALSTVIECSEMIQFTFVIGGGKKVRQKYSASLGKDFAAALISKKFNEDKGACLNPDCAGTFKYQHNTDTDLKSMHVFPFVNIAVGATGGDDEGSDDPDSPLKVCSDSTLDMFEQTVTLKVQSYAQKMNLNRQLKEIRLKIDAIDSKLVKMEALTPSEDVLYNSVQDIQDKMQWLQKEIQSMVDKGQLTNKEAMSLKKNLTEKQNTIRDQITNIDPGTSKKKLEKLSSVAKTLAEQLSKVNGISPIKRNIKYSTELAELNYRVECLEEKMDNNTATLDDMGEIQKLKSKVASFKAEQEEMYWFEDENLVERVVYRPKSSKKKASAQPTTVSGWSSAAKSGPKRQLKKTGAKPQANSFASLF